MLVLKDEMPKDWLLIPSLNKILVKCYDESDTYDTGGLIVKPVQFKDDVKPCIGMVVAAGPECLFGEELLGKDVYFGSYAGASFKVDGVVYKCFKEEDIYCTKVPRGE